MTAINRFVEVGTREGWDAAGEQPRDDREELASEVLAVVEEANRTGAWRELRTAFPPAHEPFARRLRELAIGIGDPRWVDDAHVVARVGTAWRPEAVVEFGVDGEYAATDALAAGRSPDRRWFAIAREQEVEIRDGFRGAVAATLPLSDSGEPAIKLQPFPDGREVLVTRGDGVFVLGSDGWRRLPFHFDEDEEGDDEQDRSFSMIHAAMSPDGRLIAIGHQSSSHVILNRDGRRVAEFGPIHSEYPHHAAFSADGAHVIVNACHFYNGVTMIGRVSDVAGLDLEPYHEAPCLRVLDKGCRVYASTFHRDLVLLGDAYGYVRAFGLDGQAAWQLFCGSSIGGIDVSPDGRKLAVATAAGYLQLYEMDVDEPDPFQIGTARHHELIRFVRWKDRPMLRW